VTHLSFRLYLGHQKDPESEKSIGKRDILKNHLANLGAKQVNIVSVNDSLDDMESKIKIAKCSILPGV